METNVDHVVVEHRPDRRWAVSRAARRPRRCPTTHVGSAFATVLVMMFGGVTACDNGDDDDAGDVNAAWCQGLGEFTAATLGTDDASDDQSEAALADVQTAISDLRTLEVPDEIADDWSTVGSPLATSATGGLEPNDDQTEAGRRVASWALDHCELSDEVRDALSDSSG